MAEFHIALGATADVASSVELDEAVSGVQGSIHTLGKSLLDSRRKPIRRKMFAESAGVSTLIGGQTVLIVPMDGTPAVERYWSVRSITVFDTISPMNGAYAGVQFALAIGNSSAPSTTDLTGAVFSALPFGDTFNETSIRVTPNQNLYLVSAAATFAAPVGFAVEIDEYLDCAYNQQSI